VRDLADAIAIHRPEQREERDYRCRPYRRALVPRGRDRELQDVPGLVPHAAVVAGDDAEAVRARTQIAVVRLAVSAHLTPVVILAFEPDSELILFRYHEAERRVVDLKVARQRR